MRSSTSLFGVLLGVVVLSGCSANLSEPIDQALRRETPLSFGLHVSPSATENPITPPERFEGYHTAVDYEVSVDELDKDVAVYAVCDGKVLYSGYADGYGGVVVHSCRVGGEDVTVLYGHLLISSMIENGKDVEAGQKIAVLAPARSYDSGGNRKHLHFAVHRGTELQMLGYVQNESDLDTYIDPKTVLAHFSLESLEPNLEAYWRTQSGATTSSAN